jgi:hypothetical protein
VNGGLRAIGTRQIHTSIRTPLQGALLRSVSAVTRIEDHRPSTEEGLARSRTAIGTAMTFLARARFGRIGYPATRAIESDRREQRLCPGEVARALDRPEVIIGFFVKHPRRQVCEPVNLTLKLVKSPRRWPSHPHRLETLTSPSCAFAAPICHSKALAANTNANEASWRVRVVRAVAALPSPLLRRSSAGELEVARQLPAQ